MHANAQNHHNNTDYLQCQLYLSAQVNHLFDSEIQISSSAWFKSYKVKKMDTYKYLWTSLWASSIFEATSYYSASSILSSLRSFSWNSKNFQRLAKIEINIYRFCQIFEFAYGINMNRLFGEKMCYSLGFLHYFLENFKIEIFFLRNNNQKFNSSEWKT